ncbi:SWIRM domain-containing protein [Phycomyces blakesleeanus]
MAAPQQPKIDFNFYEQPSTISYFDAIIDHLRSDLAAEGADTALSAPELAFFTARFQHFQQDTLGVEAAEAAHKAGQPIEPRLPAHFFNVEQLSVSSPLYTILLAAYSFQWDREMDDWQLDAPEGRPMYLKLTAYIRERLVAAGFYKLPCIGFAEDVLLNKRKEFTWMIQSMKGELAENDTTATHILHGNDNTSHDNHSGRIIERKNNRVLVHYLGLPTSYDTWKDETECKAMKEMNPINQTQYHVKASWLKDSFLYNEWMNEADYDEPDHQTSPTTLKRSGELSQLNDISSPAKKAKTPTPSSIKEPTEPEEPPVQESPQIKHIREEEQQKFVSKQPTDIIIPSYAAWFDMTQINEIEERFMPEFFNNKNKSKTPSAYKDYRDFIINTYRMNPLEYLSITACRRNLIGDVCSIIRVHAFLEQWGLINYQVDLEAKPSNIIPAFDSQYKIISEDPPAEHPIVDEIPVKTPTPKDHKEVPRGNCNTCGEKCVDDYYESSQTNGICLCKSCYLEGKYPVELHTGDFIRHLKEKEKEKEKEEKWTKDEEKQLLEGLELYDDDWNKVADHVGCRTRDACVLHYLDLSTKDPFVDTEIAKLGILQFDKSEPTENPIMSTVAFLASTVDPVVAKAASKQDANQKMKRDPKKGENGEEEENALRTLAFKVIRAKLDRFEDQLANYKEKEEFVEEEKQRIERERQRLAVDRIAFKKKVQLIEQEIIQRNGVAAAMSNAITPAQIQQQMAGAGLAGRMPMMLSTQQQQQLQQQMQQQQQHQQQQHQSHQHQQLQQQNQHQQQQQQQQVQQHSHQHQQDQVMQQQHQQQHSQTQQQRFQLQLQMQMQAQQQGQFRPSMPGSNFRQF